MTAIRPRRSALYLPASNLRAIAKARSLAADVVILDLEDAVAPEAKQDARASAAAAAREDWGRRELVVRANALDTAWGADDLAALARLPLAAVLVPKVEMPDDVRRYDAALGDGAALWVMIETCRAISNLQAIADTTGETRLAGFVVGANDLAKEMRARPASDRAELIGVLTLTVCAARASGLMVLDAVSNNFTDLDRFAAECRQGRALGFDGKTLIHPAQIDPANAAFGPSAAELDEARAIVAAFATPDATGKGAIQLDGRMVERLHLAEAERTLALGAAIDQQLTG